jgi:hypothetical protein
MIFNEIYVKLFDIFGSKVKLKGYSINTSVTKIMHKIPWIFCATSLAHLPNV